ncbi:MAG TPA: universal stress protein, partial [Solirubrobacteraceae bacterium]
ASGTYQTKLGLPEEKGGFAGDPVLGVVKQLHLGVAQHAAETYVGLLAATILFLGTNAGLIGVSRLVYSMGVHRQMPDGLRKLHPRFRTPWIGILVFSGFAILVCLPGQANFLGSVYSFGALLSWTIAHLAVIRLRFKLPNAERPYSGPGNWRVGGVDLPLFALAGGAFTAIAFVVIVVLHPVVAVVGVGWLLVGTLMYVWFRHHHGLDLTSTHKVVIPHAVIDREVEYDSVLIPALDGHYDENVLATAAKLAARGKSGIHVLSLVTVPSALPIDARLRKEFMQAESVIDQARLQGGRRVSGHIERIRAGQAGRRIIEAASEMHATAIVMPLPHRGNSASPFGKTVESVLADRPCRVILESSPN